MARKAEKAKNKVNLKLNKYSQFSHIYFIFTWNNLAPLICDVYYIRLYLSVRVCDCNP